MAWALEFPLPPDLLMGAPKTLTVPNLPSNVPAAEMDEALQSCFSTAFPIRVFSHGKAGGQGAEQW